MGTLIARLKLIESDQGIQEKKKEMHYVQDVTHTAELPCSTRRNSIYSKSQYENLILFE